MCPEQPGEKSHQDGVPTSNGRARVTLAFTSDSGRQYLYDDASSSIIPWNALREAVLQASLNRTLSDTRDSLDATYGRGNVDATIRFIKHWSETYGAFVRESKPLPGDLSDEEISDYVRGGAMQLVLVVTESCNLRCRYCVYSGAYHYERVNSERHMTLDLAIRAVDWFVNLVSLQRGRFPNKRFGLTFFGGEPLTNMPVVRAVLEYAEAKYPGWFQPGLTTNGTLLSPPVTDVMVRHDVNLAVSLDGPEPEHDRQRVDSAGCGTHARIIDNLTRLRNEHPRYYRERVVAVSVYDCHTDVDAASHFFRDNEGLVPPAVFVNMVSDKDTDCWANVSADDRTRMGMRLTQARDAYKRSLTGGPRVGTYGRLLGGWHYFQLVTRRRSRDRVLPFLPFSAACVPGQRITVQVDGTLDLCERINGTRPIGSLFQGGIEPAKIRALVADYRNAVLHRCTECAVTRLCNICYAHALGNGTFRDMTAVCDASRLQTILNLKDYVSLKEASPDAEVEWASDTMLLEKRLLFFS